MPGFDMKDYATVAERITGLKAEYPQSSLQSKLEFVDRDGVFGWLCTAWAYRTPDDPMPGVGHAFEPVPGKTPYTRDSEVMNAETSAWGRAIVALGFPTKKIASAEEVQARQDPPSGSGGPAKRARKPEAKKVVTGPAAGEGVGASSSPVGAPTPDVGIDTTAKAASATIERDNEGSVPETWKTFASKDQRQRLFDLKNELGVSDSRLREILQEITHQRTTSAIPAELFGKVFEAVENEAIPFG